MLDNYGLTYVVLQDSVLITTEEFRDLDRHECGNTSA